MLCYAMITIVLGLSPSEYNIVC